MAEAVKITGLCRLTIGKYAAAGDIPGAIRRTVRCAPWYFTEAGLRRFMGIVDDEQGAA